MLHLYRALDGAMLLLLCRCRFLRGNGEKKRRDRFIQVGLEVKRLSLRVRGLCEERGKRGVRKRGLY